MNIALAELLIKAANTRESSYVVTKRAPFAGRMEPIEGHYEMSMEEACKSASEALGQPHLCEPVRLLLQDSWNQALDWAQDQLRPK